MPKVPADKSDRIKFCVNCEREIQWQASRCKTCGARQPTRGGQFHNNVRQQVATAAELPVTRTALVVSLLGLVGVVLVALSTRGDHFTIGRLREFYAGLALCWIVITWVIIRTAVFSAIIAAKKRQKAE